MALQQVEVLMRNGLDIGIGVASATGSPMAKGAQGAVTTPEVGGGASGSFTFRRIQMNEELATSLGIDADISGGVGLFRASDSFNLQKEMKLQSNSLSVLVAAELSLAFEQMDDPELTEAASKLRANGKEQDFADQFGEYFVRGISSGGRFVGVVRIDTKSSDAKTQLDNDLKGNYGLAISGDVRVKITEAMKRADAFVEARIIFEGGEVTTRPTSDNPVELLEQLFTAMDEWTHSVRQDPKAYSVTLAPYIVALGPRPPNVAQFEHQRDVLIRCAKLRLQTMDKLNLIDYMLDPRHMDEFDSAPDGPNLPELQTRLASDMDLIADAASHAIDNIADACDPETFAREKRNPPIPGFTLTALPPNLPKHTGGQAVLPPPPAADGLPDDTVDFGTCVPG